MPVSDQKQLKIKVLYYSSVSKFQCDQITDSEFDL